MKSLICFSTKLRYEEKDTEDNKSVSKVEVPSDIDANVEVSNDIDSEIVGPSNIYPIIEELSEIDFKDEDCKSILQYSTQAQFSEENQTILDLEKF